MPMWPTRAYGIRLNRPFTIPRPARRIGAMTTFLPAIFGALMVCNGVSISSYINGKSRVTS